MLQRDLVKLKKYNYTSSQTLLVNDIQPSFTSIWKMSPTKFTVHLSWEKQDEGS